MSLQGSGGGGPPLNPHSHLTGGGIQLGVPQAKRFNGRRRTSDGSSVTDRSMSLAGRTGLIVSGTSAAGPVQAQDNIAVKNELKKAKERMRRSVESSLFGELANLISFLVEDDGLNGSAEPRLIRSAVLKKTIDQLKKLPKNSEHHGGTDLQGNQVSSSKSNLMGLDVLGPLAWQSLDGFILLINSDALIQYVSENVVLYLGQTPSELESRNVFEFVHGDDISKISTNLKLADVHQSQGPRRCQFPCKFLSQSSVADNGSLVFDDAAPGNHLVPLHKDHNRARYVEMYLISTIIPKNHGGHSAGSPPSPGGNSLLCIVRRVSPTERGPVSTGLSFVDENMKQSIAGCSSLSSVDQFSTRLNQFGRLLASDLSFLGERYSQILKQALVEGRLFEELCEPRDRAEFRKQFQAALESDISTGLKYSLRAIPDKPSFLVHVKFTKFNSSNRDLSDAPSIHVIAVHSIIVDELKELDKEQSNVSPQTGSVALTNNQSNLHSNSPNTLVLKGASGSRNGSTTPSIPQQNLGTNDGNNNTSFGGMGKTSEKLRNLLELGKSRCNSNSSSPLSMGASAAGPVVGAGTVPASGHTILKKLLNNSADAVPQGPVDVVKQETKRHSIFLAGKKNDNLIEAPDAKRSRPDAQLAYQNPMLASMLATPMPVSSVPPPMTNSISQLPQDRLPKNLEQKLLPTPIPSTSGQCSSSTNTSSSASSTHPLMAIGHSSSPSASGGELELSQILEDVWKLEDERTQIPSSPAPTTPTTVNSLSTSQTQNAIETSAQPGLMPISPITNSPVLTLLGGGMMPPQGGSESPQSSLQTLLTSPVPSPRPQIPAPLASGHMIKSPGSHTPILVAQNSSPANALVLHGPPVASPLTNTSTHDDHSNSPSVLSISSPSSFPLGGSSPPLVPPVVLRSAPPPPVVNMPQHLGNNQEALLQEILDDLVDVKTAPSVSPMDPTQAISEIERHLMSTSNSIVSEPYLGPQRLSSQPMQMGPPLGMNLGMQIQIPSQQPPLQQLHMSAVTRLGYPQGAMAAAVPRSQLRMMGVPMGHGPMGAVVQQQQGQPMAGGANFKLQQQQLQRQKMLETQQMARLLANQQNQHMPQQQQQQQQQQSLSLQQHQQQQSQQAHLQLINDSEPPPNVSLQPASPKWPIPPRMSGTMVPGAQHLRAQPQPYPQGPLQ